MKTPKGPKILTICVILLGWAAKYCFQHYGQERQSSIDISIPEIKLTYFDARGRGEAIRLALADARLVWEEDR